MGSISLETMPVTIGAYETIDSSTMEQHFIKLRRKYPKAQKIHLILDNGSYNTSHQTKEAAKKHIVPYYTIYPPIAQISPQLNDYGK